ncbi:prolipoprotein diacylglyceryl transferase [Formicincola oecophyllae]|uniref:Phosphatidylglycerol--prolipoprotein diacylglyceryl transferase n=1 Tax=Formicincola oecophyllae TaxID=2558361 RepID=A0A4Y6U7T7_9PROT|nr:prolipoprotein diacylglyceryl transferase [Formicincola oecophyllae]QDH13479.1 prolipoprotein diacylglyceryl transferase [Formicincola oecophyllae]
MSAPLVFPHFNPVAFTLGPLSVRWYALAYITAFLIALPLAKWLCSLKPRVATSAEVDDFMLYAVLGVLLGGRLGYVLFYRPDFYFTHPLAILETWKGGMSFHGGALGVVLALALFCWRRKLSFLAFSDRIVVVVPIGLFLGRCANFINGELWGRVAAPGWPGAMIFPQAGPLPRYPSELYEACAEGLLLFALLFSAVLRPALRARPGLISGLFLLGYAVARAGCEFFRQPDANIGFLAGHATMGQLLCIPMALAGLGLIVHALRRPPVLAEAVGAGATPRLLDSPAEQSLEPQGKVD